MDKKRTTSRLIYLFMEKIGTKINPLKIKRLVDFTFILIENTIVNLDKLHDIYFDYYSDMITNEIELTEITNDKKVLHIGSGSIPVTSILITKNTGAQVVGIDKNPDSIKKGKSCISKNNYSDKIQLLNEDAESFQVNEFDIIIVSHGVKPIKKILDHISKSMKESALVIYRTSSDPNGKISNNDKFIKEIFNIDKIVAQKKNALLISILLKKESKK
jgi:2-polyprenyl-3-methyl-5-hydroxy-6-metoxy-1,4-benzoquinol methylase